MTNKTKKIQYRITDEQWLNINVLAAERGMSINDYARWRLFNGRDLMTTLELLRSDIKDMLYILEQPSHQPEQTESILLELLLLMRKQAQPNRLESVKRELEALDCERFDVPAYRNR